MFHKKHKRNSDRQKDILINCNIIIYKFKGFSLLTSKKIKDVKMRKKKQKYYESNSDEKIIHVEISKPFILKMPNNLANRKLVIILLGLITTDSNEKYFTGEQIAEIVHLNDRRDVDNYTREHKNVDYDWVKYLSRKDRFPEYTSVIEELVISNPLLNNKELYRQFCKQYSLVKMCFESFKKYLSQIDTNKVIQNIQRFIDKNIHSIDKDNLLSYLVNNNNKQIVKKKINNIKAQNPNLEEHNDTKISLSTQQLSSLVKFFIGCGISYEIISLLTGYQKSYIHELAYKESDFKQDILSQIHQFSGRVSIDEVFLKLDGEFHFIFSAVDSKTDTMLYYEYFPIRNALSWQIFFINLKKHYPKIKLFITDGCPALNSGRESVFPKVPHQYCKFHKMRNLIQKMYEVEKSPQKLKKAIKKLKNVFDMETVSNRRRSLLELEEMLPLDTLDYFIVHIKKKWKHLTKSLTNNAAERNNRKIKKIVSGKYGLKSPETIKLLINCLWFKELIRNGKNHINPKSTIANLNITKLCQEFFVNKRIEYLFKSKCA
jgi:transposase-like protein